MYNPQQGVTDALDSINQLVSSFSRPLPVDHCPECGREVYHPTPCICKEAEIV